MGPPGAGKGTQAKRLVAKYNMKHLSSGDIFRAEKASGSELGEKLAEYMSAGQLVPDAIVVEMMAKAIANVDAAGGMMLDGFPRTVAQAEALDAQLAQANTPLDAVVAIDADSSLIVGRITGRRSCPACGEAFHVTFLKPKAEGVCDACGAELVQRDDDTEAVVRERLDAYYAQTQPVIDYYRSCDGLDVLDIDGGQGPDEVAAAVAEALDSLQSGN